ncbi:hypothetical protein V496_04472 [Pseudogymnoascus sp. VKM F-4515 (FW-2607)]|nr:hypothetical protein V496_04472 [Pseudogymnoascus sp. VKM F-4515 (FW-2607)]
MRSLSPRLEHSRSPPPSHRRSISPRRSRSPSYDRNGGRRATRSISRSPSPDVKSTKIVVERLTKNINESHLRELFGSFGEIIDMDMPMNRQSYLLYAVEADADQAIAHMHESQLDGAVISVSIVIPRRKFSPAPPLARRGGNIEPRARMDARGPPPPRRRSPNRNYNRGAPSDTYRPRSLSRSRQDLRGGAVEGETMRTVMELGGEVRVTAATAAIAVAVTKDATICSLADVRIGPMPTVHVIIHPNPHSDSDVALPRLPPPAEQEVDAVVHIMASNATQKPETATAFPSKLSRSSTAAPILVTVPAPSIPGAVDGPQETPVTPSVKHTEEAKAVEMRPSDTIPLEAPASKISDQLVESLESKTSPTVPDVEENSGPIDPLGQTHAQERPATLPVTEDRNARIMRLAAIIPPPAGKPYQTGIQVPSQDRLADGFPYPPGLATYEILEADWNKFTAHLVSLIDPPSKKKKKTPIRMVLPFGGGGGGGGGGKVDFQKSLSKVFEFVRASQNSLFRPKGLLVRVDIPEEGAGMEFMDLYHEGNVLSNAQGAESSNANAAPGADGKEVNATAEEIIADANVAETPLQPSKADKISKAQVKFNKTQDKINKAQKKIDKAKDKTLGKVSKQERRVLGHLDSAQKKMSNRIRIVIEPITVLDNAERSEKNGWTAWIRHCDNYGSQLTK